MYQRKKERKGETSKEKKIEIIEQRKKAQEGGMVTQYFAGIRYSFLSKHTALFNPYPANVDNMASSYQC